MFAAIQLPESYLQALLRTRPEYRHQPVAVLDEGAKTSTKQDRGKARVLQCSPEAAEFGVHIGMTATQAQARCEYLALLNRSPTAEEQLQKELFAYADSLSPDYEATSDGLCILDVGGIAHIQDCLRIEALGREIVRHFAGIQLKARVGFATNPDLARLAARALEFGCINRPRSQFSAEGCADKDDDDRRCRLQYDDSVDSSPVLQESSVSDYTVALPPPSPDSSLSPEVLVIFPGEETCLDPLPLEVLDLSPEWRELFQLWGIQTIRQIKELDRADLIERLGTEAGQIHDCAAGCRKRLLKLVRPVPHFEAQMSFDYEVDSLEPLLFVARRLLETLAARLTGAYLVAAGIFLRLDYQNGNQYRRSFRIPEPCADVDLLLSLLHSHLEDFTAEAFITGLYLQATPARGGRHQFDLFVAGLKDPNQLAETLARLDAILGGERIGTPKLLPTHRPDSFTMIPFCPERVERKGLVSGPVSLLTGLPLRRFRPRLHVEVRCRGRPRDDDSTGSGQRFNPVAILTGPLRGEIATALGPWRSSGNWWEKIRLWRREEWDIVLESGEICLIAYDRKERFVEGAYG